MCRTRSQPLIMERRPIALIIPAAIRSHVLPSLYLADALADEYEVIYAVTNDVLADIVTANGYKTVRQSGNVVGYGIEPSYVVSLKQKPTFWRVFKAYHAQEMYDARQQELYALIDYLRPEAVFIDLFACTDYWVLYPRRSEFKILFFNPMPSTYRVQGYPIVSEGFWNKSEAAILPPQSFKTPLAHWFTRPKAALMNWVIAEQRKKFQQIAPLASDATVTQVIADVPELLLAPLAFEFAPAIRKPHQHYLGLCMRPHRQDTELDATFEETWGNIVENQQKVPLLLQGEGFRERLPQRLIYCSFGTFHEGADATLLRFVTNLLEVIRELPNTILVCSVNKYIIETLRHRRLLTANTHFFSRVPQMRVLAEADVFITHAGFGSIKEAIYYGVPMLAYPLDPKYDQNGNALKVEHHGLGLRGAFAHERTTDLKKKLLRLLEEGEFREQMKLFRDNITEDSSEIIHSLLGTTHYETERC